MSLDLITDYLIFDGLETVQYVVKQKGESFAAPVTVANALRVIATKILAMGQVLSSRADTTWHFWTPELSGIVPKAGDRVTDGQGVTWILSGAIVFTPLTQHWECSETLRMVGA